MNCCQRARPWFRRGQAHLGRCERGAIMVSISAEGKRVRFVAAPAGCRYLGLAGRPTNRTQ